MRKLLLGTTAVVGAALIAPAAMAQAPAPVPAPGVAAANSLTVRLGGFFDFSIWNIQDDVDTGRFANARDGATNRLRRDRFDFRSDAEVAVFVDGRAANVRTDMSIRVVARKIDADNYSVGIRSAGFGARSGKPGERVRSVAMAPPRFPDLAARAGVTGTVYLLVKAGPDGKVIDVVAEQVNLRVIAGERDMERWRRLFAETSLSKARGWLFAPPTEGGEATKDSWVLRVPVAFTLAGPAHAAYGQWESYVPGPRLPNPWQEDSEGTAFNPDVLPPGDAYLAGSGPVLLTDLSGG